MDGLQVQIPGTEVMAGYKQDRDTGQEKSEDRRVNKINMLEFRAGGAAEVPIYIPKQT